MNRPLTRNPEAGRSQTSWRNHLLVAPGVCAVGLALVGVVMFSDRYLLSVAITALTFAGYAVGWNLAFGLSGQLLLCVGAFAGTAGYVTALTIDAGAPAWMALAAGIAATTMVGLVLGWVGARRRLTAMPLGIITLAVSLVFHNVLLAGRTRTGGETGRTVGDASTELLSQRGGYLILAVFLVGAVVAYSSLAQSRFGHGCRAVRDDPIAAALAGVNVIRTRTVATTLAAAIIGTAGGLYAVIEGFVSPATYSFGHVDVRVLLLTAIGGLGRAAGPVVGAGVLTVVDEILRPFGQLRMALYGVALVAIFMTIERRTRQRPWSLAKLPPNA